MREGAPPKGLGWPLRRENVKRRRRGDFMGWVGVEGICRWGS